MGITTLECEKHGTQFAMADTDFEDVEALSCPVCRGRVFDVAEPEGELDDDDDDDDDEADEDRPATHNRRTR